MDGNNIKGGGISCGRKRNMRKRENLVNVFQCGIGFLILFIAYNSAINLQATVMQQSGFGQLGFYSLALVSLMCGFSSLSASFIIKKVGGVSRSLLIGALASAVFILVSVLPALKKQQGESDSIFLSNGFIYASMVISAIICGFGQAILWTSQGLYVS